MENSHEITELLIAWKKGDKHAIEKLIPLVESELYRIARAYMRREKKNHTLQTTALVNEAYLRLVDANGTDWQNRAQFFCVSATIMRRILINYARDSNVSKRGGGALHINIEDAVIIPTQTPQELLDLDEALNNLAKFDNKKSQIVELRYFGGLSIEEIAYVMDMAPSTVSLHWRLARSWLRNALSPGDENNIQK